MLMMPCMLMICFLHQKTDNITDVMIYKWQNHIGYIKVGISRVNIIIRHITMVCYV